MGKYAVRNEQLSPTTLETLRSSQSDEQKSMQKVRDPHLVYVSYSNIPQNRSSEVVSHCLTPPADNVLDKCDAPLHAFPSPYPPVCAYEPFPLDSCGQMFSAFQWARRPNHNALPQSPKTDINDLANRFALFNVRDLNSRRSQRNCGAMQDTLAATYSITVRPPSAPHPALIKPASVASSLPRWSPFPIVRASQPTPHAFTGSTALPLPAPPISHVTSSRRKVSHLPKRYPCQSPLSDRNVTPATSPTSSTPSPCSSLRSF